MITSLIQDISKSLRREMDDQGISAFSFMSVVASPDDEEDSSGPKFFLLPCEPNLIPDDDSYLDLKGHSYLLLHEMGFPESTHNIQGRIVIDSDDGVDCEFKATPVIR
ncbi:hypothetical protein OAL32_01930 [Synechococcus sp. AH-551-G15]|nr:hypothetical protein [Synechococcus sp. AH-551-G15]